MCIDFCQKQKKVAVLSDEIVFFYGTSCVFTVKKRSVPKLKTGVAEG